MDKDLHSSLAIFLKPLHVVASQEEPQHVVPRWCPSEREVDNNARMAKVELQDYRSLLIAAEQKAQEDYDKTVLLLSGGALGISFAFVKDIVGDQPLVCRGLLLASWIVWGISVACVLASFFFSQQALRRTIRQVDEDTIYKLSPGGVYTRITAILNALGGLLFLAGVVLIVLFASHNLG